MPAERILTPRVYVAIAFTVLAWASAFVVIRGTACRSAAGRSRSGDCWSAPRAQHPADRPPVGAADAQRLGALAVYGVIWFGAYNVALNLAEQTLDAGTRR